MRTKGESGTMASIAGNPEKNGHTQLALDAMGEGNLTAAEQQNSPSIPSLAACPNTIGLAWLEA